MGGLESGPGQLATSPLLLTAQEAAEVLRVGRTTIYALMKAGDLHTVHSGRSCRISRVPDLPRGARALRPPPGSPEPAPPRSNARKRTTGPARTLRAGLATAGRRANPQVGHPSQIPSTVSRMTPRVRPERRPADEHGRMGRRGWNAPGSRPAANSDPRGAR